MSALPHCVVLVEGRSDAAVLAVLGRRLGLSSSGVEIVPMGGVTNIRAYLDMYDGPVGTAVTGLCDAGELRFVARALRRRGHEVQTKEDLEALGFFVCEDDLEDELIRALGADAVIAVIEREGELPLLRTLQQQPAQRGRSLHDQLHRFFGTKSGRKLRLAAALAEEVDLDLVPAPLRGVLNLAHASV